MSLADFFAASFTGTILVVLAVHDQGGKSNFLRSSMKSVSENYFPGSPHGLTATHQDELNAVLLEFLRTVQKGRRAA